MMRICLTGATGLVGWGLLVELLKRSWPDLGNLEILLLGRRNQSGTLSERVERTLLTDGFAYVAPVGMTPSTFVSEVLQRIRFIEFDLRAPGLGVSGADLAFIRSKRVDHFFHVAAATDFGGSAGIRSNTLATNLAGTQAVLELVDRCGGVGEFVYASTAFVVDAGSSPIDPGSLDLGRAHRNWYEYSKAAAESAVRAWAARSGNRLRVFRIGIVCGRLMEEPLGATTKFDTFYGWGATLLHLKLGCLEAGADPFDTPARLNLRVQVARGSSVNILPVDFVAKAIAWICATGAPGFDFHLVNDRNTPHLVYLSAVLEALNIEGVTFVEDRPLGLNSEERFYYATAGKLFEPYLTSAPLVFDRSTLDRALQGSGLSCPSIDASNLRVLMDYARRAGFGLRSASLRSQVVPTQELLCVSSV